MKYLFLFCFLTFQLFASNLTIVVSKTCKIETLNATEIKNIFMKNRTKINGTNIEPLDSSDKKIQKKFINTVMHKTQSQLRAYWARMIFTGRKLPPKRVNLESFAPKKGCYIAYIEGVLTPKEWKTLQLDDK